MLLLQQELCCFRFISPVYCKNESAQEQQMQESRHHEEKPVCTFT